MQQARQVQARLSWRAWAIALLIALLGGVAGNGLVWLIGDLAGEIHVDLLDVMLFSVIGAVAGGVLYALLALLVREARTRDRIFIVICVVVLVVYAFAPIAAMQAPYKQGAQPFNVLTVIATEIMHLISGGLVIFAFTRKW